MEKNAFLRELALILRQRGLTDEEIRVRIEKISSFVDGLSQEERNALIGGTPNVAAIADKLFQNQASAKAKTADGADEALQDAQKKAEGGAGRSAEKAPDNFKITSDYKKNSSSNKGGASASRNPEVMRRDEEKLKQLKNEAQRPRKKQAGASLTLSQKYESERNFWVIFFCCIPLLFFFGTVLLTAFVALFFGLIALIIILVAVLAVAVAAGSGVALIGIGYGILQLLSNPAIGLYEAGMGIMAAGITMLVGVLIYNAAIRFIPWIMRKLKQLFKFVLKKLGVLAEYLKGVCALI